LRYSIYWLVATRLSYLLFLNTVLSQDLTYLHSVSQYQKIVAEDGKPDEIYLTKNDDKRYYFLKTDYYIENDTLYGKGKMLVDTEELINKIIALSDIESIQYEYLNVLTTTALVLVLTPIIFVVGFACLMIIGGGWH